MTNKSEMMKSTKISRLYALGIWKIKKNQESDLFFLREFQNKLIEIIGDSDGIEGICTYVVDENGKRQFNFIYEVNDDNK